MVKIVFIFQFQKDTHPHHLKVMNFSFFLLILSERQLGWSLFNFLLHNHTIFEQFFLKLQVLLLSFFIILTPIIPSHSKLKLHLHIFWLELNIFFSNQISHLHHIFNQGVYTHYHPFFYLFAIKLNWISFFQFANLIFLIQWHPFISIAFLYLLFFYSWVLAAFWYGHQDIYIWPYLLIQASIQPFLQLLMQVKIFKDLESIFFFYFL